MKYSIGDKVKIHNCEGDPWYNNKVGTIIETGRMAKTGHSTWDYLCAFEGNLNYPFGLQEMDKVSVKGQQLLFSFME